MGKFGEGKDFFIGWWKSVKELFLPFKAFSKLKTPFCKYWISNGNGAGATNTSKNEVFTGL